MTFKGVIVLIGRTFGAASVINSKFALYGIARTCKLSAVIVSSRACSDNIAHLAAFLTDKVGMRSGVAVNAFFTVYIAYDVNFSFAFEQRKIPIDCSKTQIRDIRLQPIINPTSTGMYVCTANYIVDSVAF